MKAPQPHRFLVEHRSQFHYTEPAYHSVMLLRLHPRQDRGQRVLKFNLDTEPAAALASLDDAFGNTCHLLNIHREHRKTVLESRVEVETCPAPSLERHEKNDSWEALAEMANPNQYWEYLNPSRFAYTSPALQGFVDTNGIHRGSGPVSSLLETTSKLHETFRYEPGSTEVYSPIEQILETGGGVCQDYTHVMIAIARSWGIPSRYVSGYLHLEGVAGEQTPAGASHSWGEFLLPDLGWVGIDPTNNTLSDHRHIRIAVGRDYADAAPTQGTLFCNGESSLEVQVTVRESDELAPAVSQYAQHANLIATKPSSTTQPYIPDQ